ncbi:unnamed protein product, partial [Closterium sp. Naga37s-1]
MAEQKPCAPGGAPARAPACCRRRPRRRFSFAVPPAPRLLLVLLALLLPSVLLPRDQLQRATAQFPGGLFDPLYDSCILRNLNCLANEYTCYTYNTSSVYNCSCNFNSEESSQCTKWNGPAIQCTDPSNSSPCLPGLCRTNSTSFLGCDCPKGFFQTATAAFWPYCAP